MRLVGVAVLAAALSVVSIASASGPAKAVAGQRALAVSVPVSVLVRSRTLVLGDDGKVSIGAGPDLRWSGRVGFPTAPIRVPAQGWRDVPLSIEVPHVSPDLYFIGFLVTPVAAVGGSITVVNQIGSFLTLDVPGPRERLLTGHLHLPGFVLGSDAVGDVRVTNIGHASVSMWGENDTTSSPGGALQQDRLGLSLLPVGRSRSIAVSGKPRWPVGVVTVTTRVTYPGRTASETKQLVLTKRIVVVSPWVPVALGALLAALLPAWWWHRRQRRICVLSAANA